MNTTGSSHSTIIHSDVGWLLDPGLARLAFGSRPARRSSSAATGVAAHLAFLPTESLEIDLTDPQQRAFGDYELIELIGQGGMGVVYRAKQASLDREVAVKLLSAGPWASRDFIGRFQREAQSAARMQHPNIVAIHEIGAHEEMNFFSMRLVHGGSLANMLARSGAMKPVDAARMLRTVAEAVDYAHRLDVLHLDLKPGNVLLDENGNPQVADFGLAKRLDETLTADVSEISGTPSYMAPEQAQTNTQSLSAATDIYGLGAILYECLLARPPFAGGSAHETLRQVLFDQPVPPRKINPAIPTDLQAICLKCLHKEPAHRYASARELADDLSRFLEGRETRALPLHVGGRLLHFGRREPRLTMLVSLLFFSLVFGFGAAALQWKRAEKSSATSSALLWDIRRDEALRLEREGKGFEAYPRLLSNITELESAGKKQLAGLERRRLGILLGQGAVLVDQAVLADATPLAIAVSDDGKLIAIALSDQSVRWYDSKGLVERGRVDFRGRMSGAGVPGVPRLLRFVGNTHLRVTFDWLSNVTHPVDGDTWLVDLHKKAITEPPKAFVNFADAVYSAGGDFALLRNKNRQGQLWQVNPWRPLSAITTATYGLTPWLIGPDARYAAFMDTALMSVAVYALPTFSLVRDVELPGHVSASAWSRSQGGRWLAIGDFEGRVFLLDTTTTLLKTLPTLLGREVTWTSFSEDDAWLAVGTRDGTAYAFDVTTGNPLVAGQMHQDFPIAHVGISHRHRLLVVAGKSETALWRLPQSGPRAAPAFRIGAGPIAQGRAEDYSIGWSLQTGLLASAGLDGRVQVWRLPLGTTPPAMAARQIPEKTWFDGRRLVDVEGDRIRLVSGTGNALTQWTQLPQPPGFAELLGDGKTLVVSVGAELRVFNPATMQLRYPPIALVASPERFLANDSGDRLALTFSRNGAAGFEEVVNLFDLKQGRRLDGAPALFAPLRRLAFSPDGSRLLAVGPAAGSTSVLATAGLAVLGEFPHDEFQPVTWADFSRDGATVMMTTNAGDPRLGSDGVVTWDLAADKVLSLQSTGPAEPLGIIDTQAGPFVAGSERDLLAPGNKQMHTMVRLAASESTAILARHEGEGLLAHAFRREVQLIDITTGSNLGPPLQTDSDANDVIVQLAFSPDGQGLLARTLQGHWRVWSIAPRTEPVSKLASDHVRMASSGPGLGAIRLPSAAERLAMREADPGAWTAAEVRPAQASIATADMKIPLRAAQADPLMVDLGAFYTSDPDMVRSLFYNVRPQMRPVPIGIQRLDGVDYDLRGMAQFGTHRGNERFIEPVQQKMELRCIPVAGVPTAALHLLLQISTPVPVPGGTEMARVTLHYSDGSEAAIPIRSEREVPGFGGADQDVPMALATNAALTAFGLTDPGLSSPRLENPFPGRPLRCIDIQTRLPANPILLFAITQEPAAMAAVIASPVYRSERQASASQKEAP